MRHLLLTLFLVCALSPRAQAQLIPGLTGGAREEPAAQASEPEAPAQALVDILKDDAARQGLIAELEKIAAQESDGAAEESAAQRDPDGDAGPAPASAEAQQAPRGLAVRLAALARETVEQSRQSAISFARGLSSTAKRLEALQNPTRLGELWQAVQGMALTIIATLAVFWALRLPARRLTGRVGAAEDKRSVARVMRWLGCLAVDILTVLLAWGAGYAIAWGAVGATRGVSENEALYLNAFLVVELARAAIRAVYMPRSPALRLPPFTDEGAAYWASRMASIAALLGYGLLLAAPLVGDIFFVFTRRAIEVVIYALAAIWAIALVLRHRRAPLRFVRRREAERGADASTRLLKVIAHIWHWPVLAWLVVLFVVAVSQSGAVAGLLISTAKVLGVLAAAGALSIALGELARRGVRLPGAVSASLPLLEPRLNGFLRRFLGAARLLIQLVAIAAAIRVSGAVSFADGQGVLNEPALGALLTVGVIAAVAFALWLGIVSWVDYRLSEDRFPRATAREETLLTLMRNAATVAIVVIALMMALSELGLDIGPLLASAGVLGLAIGFGAQKLVQDIITGIFIQFERAISVGDVVTVAGTTGTVEKLTVRSVSLRDLNGVFHIIPFSSVDMVSNFTRDFSYHLADLGIAYREDVEDGKQAMLAAFDELRGLESHRHDILGDLEWFGVNALGDSAVTLRARIRTRPGKQWAVGRAYNELLKKHCDALDVEIPFPQTTLWFGVGKDGGAPPMRIEGAVRNPDDQRARTARPDAPTPPQDADRNQPQNYDTPDSDDDA